MMRWALALVVIGCASAPPPVARPPAPVIAEVEAPVVVRRTQSLCERASACCHAYVDVVVGVTGGAEIRANIEQACGVPAAISRENPEAAEEACRAMIEAYEQALVAMQRPVPAECQSPRRSCCATGRRPR
jgi:hypothetical protein